MAEKKTSTKKTTTRKTKASAQTVKYRGRAYTVLERNDHKVKLTDGVIHFWAKADDVED